MEGCTAGLGPGNLDSDSRGQQLPRSFVFLSWAPGSGILRKNSV